MILSSDLVSRSFLTEVPEKYLEQPPDYLTAWFKHINVWIGLPGIKDSKAVFGDIPEAQPIIAIRSGCAETSLKQSRFHFLSHTRLLYANHPQ
jgi:hypothetical protein